MKIYLASSAPGDKDWQKRYDSHISKRLLSFYSIKEREFSCDYVLELIKKRNENISGQWNGRNEGEG